MGNPLKVAEDTVEIADKNNILNSLLKIVTLLSYHYAPAERQLPRLLGTANILKFLLYLMSIIPLQHTEKRLHIWRDIIDYI